MKLLSSVSLYILISLSAGALAQEKHVYTGNPKFAYGFSSNMVIQRDVDATVWGFATPGTEVEVSIGDQDAKATTDQYGQWLVQLDPMPAGGPYTLELKGGDSTETLESVMVGDVWICSGQSNMRYALDRRVDRKDPNSPRIFQEELDALEEAGTSSIYHVMKDRKGEFNWMEVTQNASDRNAHPNGVSAVGYFFAKHLKEHIGDVPIGIIQTGAGGKAMRHFIPKDVQWNDPDLKSLWFQKLSFRRTTYMQDLIEQHGEEKLARHEAEINAWLNGESGSEVCPVYISDFPGYLFYSSLPPLKHLKFKGMLWYQGESDRGRYNIYPKHLEVLIDFYREYFNYPDMPFVVIALPPHDLNHYEKFTDAQITFADNKEGVAIAYAPEGGDKDDIHPPKKEIVGERSALSAAALAYDKDVAYLGPRLASADRRGDQVIITFKDTAGGLKLTEGVTELAGFQIGLPNEDNSLENVKAEISQDRDRVVVMVPEKFASSRKLVLRFNYTPYYVPFLYGGNDLPAVSFSTTVE